jgi:excisionase family DNA binding protein
MSHRDSMQDRISDTTGAVNTAEIFTDPEAAQYLVTTPRTLRLWRHTKGLPHLKLTARTIRYRKSDLDSWLNQHRVAVVA